LLIFWIVTKNQRKVCRAGNPVPKYSWGRPLGEPGHAIGVIAFFCDEFSLLTFFCGQKKVRIKYGLTIHDLLSFKLHDEFLFATKLRIGSFDHF